MATSCQWTPQKGEKCPLILQLRLLGGKVLYNTPSHPPPPKKEKETQAGILSFNISEDFYQTMSLSRLLYTDWLYS